MHVECVEMCDLTSYDRPDVMDDVSSELTDDLGLLRNAPMISPWPHWREILVDIGSFSDFSIAAVGSIDILFSGL